jgi:hypothetical protein
MLVSIFTKGGGSLSVGYDRPQSFDIAADGVFHYEASDNQANDIVDPIDNDVIPVGPIPGDVNADGIFDSSDLVAVFVANEYEDGVPNNSTFEEGDWNGDGDFDSSDLVMAFTASRYVSEARRLDPESIDSIFGQTDKGLTEKDSHLATNGIEDSLEFDANLMSRVLRQI